jgi:hypothetical protein
VTRQLVRGITFATVLVAAAGIGLSAQAQQAHPNVGYQDTPTIPGTKWHVHDGGRPQPRVVDPGPGTAGEFAPPPSDAIVLFDGKDTSKWRGDKGDCPWKIENGYMEARQGSISTRDSFGDCQLHVEFCTPNPPKGDSQGRGNSGVYIMGRYEIQILDSYNNPTYADGSCGSVYGQYPPLVNASRKPGEWQSYDIVFTSPRFQDGKMVTPGIVTVIHNGVLVQNHTEIMGITNHRVLPKVEPHDLKAPLGLQDHGNPMRFRNIWIRELKDTDRN